MYVQPFVFIYTSFEDLDIKHCPREVENHVWTNLEFLARNDDRFFYLRDQNSKRYGTTKTVQMPTLKLINAHDLRLEDVLREPKLVDEEFPLGGFTMYLTGHMLLTGGLIPNWKGWKKYWDYRIKGI